MGVLRVANLESSQNMMVIEHEASFLKSPKMCSDVHVHCIIGGQ